MLLNIILPGHNHISNKLTRLLIRYMFCLRCKMLIKGHYDKTNVWQPYCNKHTGNTCFAAIMNCNKDACAHWRDCDSISQKHCSKSWKNLVRLWRAQKLCDVVIIVQDQRFPCHGIVPASTSPFFRSAFLKKNAMSLTDSTLCEKEVIVDFMNKDIFAQVTVEYQLSHALLE